MDAKLYCFTVALNTTLVFKNFPMNKGTENSLALGTRISWTWETPVKLQIPSTLLETPLIRNIWRISPQQLSCLEEWKPNISNILYMEWNTAKHINTNSHDLWHFGTQLRRSNPHSISNRKIHLSPVQQYQDPLSLPDKTTILGFEVDWTENKNYPVKSKGPHYHSRACSPL